MSIRKITFLFRSPSVGYQYKSANQRDLAEDLAAALMQYAAPTQPVRISNGSVQHHFYITSDAPADRCKEDMCKTLETLVTDEALRKQIIVSVSEPSAEELDDLRQKVSTEDNVAFWNAVDNTLPQQPTPFRTPIHPVGEEAAAEKKPPVPEDEQPVAPVPPTRLPTDYVRKILALTSDPVKEPAKTSDEAPDEASNEAPDEAPAATATPLAAQAARIHALKTTLLQKVRGQRHAVDTVLQGVFDAEMFASNDPQRKGPLATFLFAGPSGVGKTFLAKLMGANLDREPLLINMSEYSSNLSHGRFNGEFDQPALLTGFARQHPRGILIFDEIEKAHINTIHQFLQILDGGSMMDHKLRKEVSFKDNIVIMTTNAGQSLYEDPTIFDLSATPRQVIIDGLRKDVNPQTKEPFFPECITTRLANGRVILFNHLEPYALRQIIEDEIALQISLFEKSSGVKVHYDPVALSALVLYHGGGVADARSLRGLARNILVQELQEMVMQLAAIGPARVEALREISLVIDTNADEPEIRALFSTQKRLQAVTLSDALAVDVAALSDGLQTDFTVLTDAETFRQRVRGVVDYVLLDPLFGNPETDQIPNDVEDLKSVGMQMFEYLREYLPEVPVYLLDTSGKIRTFDTLLARGARGVVRVEAGAEEALKQTLQDLATAALINNNTFSLGRSNKFLSFNCAQYLVDEQNVVVSFEKLTLKSAPQAGDGAIIAKKGSNNGLKFDKIVGCKAAKEALSDYRDMLEDPREAAMKGKKMPKGVLLYGPPGTGKTMLAKAMANECSATFIPTTAASFFGPYVGQTEQNIRSLFQKARKYAPAIIFIDEVDAIARRRTGGVGTTHNEDALTVLLAELDGFVADEKRPVFVIAATNYELDGESGCVLDPAFVRRFDQKILIPLPDTDDRYALLCMSLERHGIHFGDNHEKVVRNMAARTAGMNNADLEMINANYARTLGDGQPNPAAYMDSLDAYRFGEVQKMDPAHLRQTACHEAGHALVCRLSGVTPSFLTIVSRGNYGGYMESATETERGTHTYQELMDRVCRSLAGRVAEIEVYGETAGNNTGASSDIRQARHLLETALNDFAMGDKLYARWTQDELEAKMRDEFRRTCEMIHQHRAVLDALTDRLVEEKSMDQTQLEEFFNAMHI